MHAVVKRVLLISLVALPAFAMTFALRFPKASAAETSAVIGDHSKSAASTNLFELSRSLRALCKRTGPNERIQYGDCGVANYYAALMNAEPIDKAWAKRMEIDLRKSVSDDFTLKNVDCRLSWCILEVGSTPGDIFGVSIHDLDKWKLFELRDLFAPDVDDPSLQDQVVFYKRYCRSSDEILDGNGHLLPNFNAAGKDC